MLIYSEPHVALPNERKIVYEQEIQKHSNLRSGLYRFFGNEDHLCSVNIQVDGKPIKLWLDKEVSINEELKQGMKVKVEVINHSANTLILQVMFRIEEF